MFHGDITGNRVRNIVFANDQLPLDLYKTVASGTSRITAVVEYYDMYLMFGACNWDVLKAACGCISLYSVLRHPNDNTLCKLDGILRHAGNVPEGDFTAIGWYLSVRTPLLKESVVREVETHSEVSICTLASHLNVDKSSVHQIWREDTTVTIKWRATGWIPMTQGTL